VIDWNALEGWLITALLLLVVVGIAWWRRYRRNPEGFRRSWSRLPSDWRQPSDRFRPPH
jgi:hypothetical protein